MIAGFATDKRVSSRAHGWISWKPSAKRAFEAVAGVEQKNKHLPRF